MPIPLQNRSILQALCWCTPCVGSDSVEALRRKAIAENEILRAVLFFRIQEISRAPFRIRRSRQPDFEPRLVSIGPYFHGREHLLPMEQLKPKFISEFLLASSASQPVDPVPVDPFRDLLRNVRGCYKERVEYKDDNFLQILVRDSLFVIGIILLFQKQVPMTFKDEFALEDMNIKGIRSDLLLLENQIPLFFIEKVYDWIMKDHKFPFATIVEPFIGFDMPWGSNEHRLEDPAHLLDLYWRCSLPPEIFKRMGAFQQDEPEPNLWAKSYIPVSDSEVIPNATTLTNKAGIKFKKHCQGLDVHFSKGIMHMPCLIIDSNQTTILTNLIAFENSMPPSYRIFHNYIKLMDDLVDSEKDVELLQECGVIYNKLSSRTDAATFFNDIGNYCLVDIKRHLFSDLYKDLQKYYSSNWHQWLASLHRNYFSNPWTGISVVAAGTLLIMSAVQTFYTVYGYYHQGH